MNPGAGVGVERAPCRGTCPGACVSRPTVIDAFADLLDIDLATLARGAITL
jgi:hypothetical protein